MNEVLGNTPRFWLGCVPLRPHQKSRLGPMDCELSSDDRQAETWAAMRVEYKVLRWGGMAAERLERILNDLGTDSWTVILARLPAPPTPRREAPA